jgi:hypothetical protein
MLGVGTASGRRLKGLNGALYPYLSPLTLPIGDKLLKTLMLTKGVQGDPVRPNWLKGAKQYPMSTLSPFDVNRG